MNETFTGLGTFTLYAPMAGYLTVSGKIQLNTIPQGDPVNSSVVVTINKNGGSTLYTGPAAAEGFFLRISCAIGDAINIILSSSNVVDQGPNQVQMTVSLF